MPIVCYCNISEPITVNLEFIYLNSLNSLVNSSSISTDIDVLGNNSHCSLKHINNPFIFQNMF